MVPVSTSADKGRVDRDAEPDQIELRRRLRDCCPLVGLTSRPDDPIAVHNELLQGEWESRWPKHPQWLDRRLHGEGPVQMRTLRAGPGCRRLELVGGASEDCFDQRHVFWVETPA
jgi:hypothetical protein